MSLQDRLKPLIKIAKFTSIFGGGALIVAYHIMQTYKSLSRIVNNNVLDAEKKYAAEYIYIDDPAYNNKLKMVKDLESRHTVGLIRVWKSLKHSLAWRMLWLCRHGNKEQRNIALEQLASFKNNKNWDCCKLAQAMDMNTAVLLARTRGVDLRYFLPPPIHIRRAALTSELLSFKYRGMLKAVQAVNPHSCIKHFLSKHFVNIQEQAIEVDIIPTKPDSISERDLCLLCIDALHHHLSLFYTKQYAADESTKTLIDMGILPRLAELLLRYRNDFDIDFAVLRIFTVLSVHTELLQEFFQNGLIGELSRLVRSKDVRLSSSAAVCLTNLSGENCYRPGLYLLYPIYRTSTQHICDTLLVHGLRGGVFVTWRQRDKKCSEPVGILDITISDNDCDPCEVKPQEKYLDPELQQVMDDLIELDDESLLSDYEVVLHDLPIKANRETQDLYEYTAFNKRTALIQEEEDKCSHTLCWPKDWLPKDCNNLRILGVNYWSSLSEWVERCPLQPADIATRASDLAPALVDAGVGNKNTPVVWLAHSMGGLIVKQVLLEASESTNYAYKQLSENTKAILFYSTPHKGSSLATMPRAAAAVLWPSSDVRQLQENSPVLLQLHSKFIKLADEYGWETISFAETMPTLVTTFKVPIRFVESFSADLGRGAFYQLPLDHLSICKPATRQSILYTSLLDVLLRVTSKPLGLKYTNNFIEWIKRMIWCSSWNKTTELIDQVEESQTDSLRWYEQFLLNTFTDGFTD